MAARKYEHLIKPLSVGELNMEEVQKAPGGLGAKLFGPGNARREFRLNGPDHLEGANLNFSWGVHTETGEWHPGLDPHVHPYAECLLFVGLDTASAKYLGAEVECCLGEEKEIYTFNEPTAIVVPAGVPHGPITTKRMYSPRGFGFWAVELQAVSDITWLGEGVADLTAEQRNSAPDGLRFAAPEKALRNKPVPPTGKYAHLVKSLKPGLIIERGKYSAAMEEKARDAGQKLGPGNTDHLIMMPGKDLEGLNAGIFWGFASQPGIWRRGVGAHVHPTDEVLVYLGLDPNAPDNLGAEIELDLGAEHERHFINKSSVVVCPAGMPHLPQVTRWVDKPFAFFAIYLSGEHEVKSFD
jgi:hypothetical protein